MGVEKERAGEASGLPPSARPGVVVGLVLEARVIGRLGWPIAIGGGTASGAETAAKQLVARGVAALLSIGLAGGLDPNLRPGDVVAPRAVRTAGRVLMADAWWRAALGGREVALALGAEWVVAEADEKMRLWRDTGAAVVDLESDAVGRVAAAHGLPFAVLRVVCDPAGRSLPPAALVASGQGGRIAWGRLFASLLGRPDQIPALVGLAREAAAAKRALADWVALKEAETTGRPR